MVKSSYLTIWQVPLDLTYKLESRNIQPRGRVERWLPELEREREQEGAVIAQIILKVYCTVLYSSVPKSL
jgi:hypothetical protein